MKCELELYLFLNQMHPSHLFHNTRGWLCVATHTQPYYILLPKLKYSSRFSMGQCTKKGHGAIGEGSLEIVRYNQSQEMNTRGPEKSTCQSAWKRPKRLLSLPGKGLPCYVSNIDLLFVTSKLDEELPFAIPENMEHETMLGPQVNVKYLKSLREQFILTRYSVF